MSRYAKWLRLVLVMAAAAAGIFLLHCFSDRLPGPVGQTYRHTAKRDIDAAALFYTEAGRVGDFIDETNGRYRTAGPATP